MSRRHGKGASALAAKTDPADLRRLVERLLEKRQYKDALKQAKVGFRQDGCPDNRRLLERASYQRAAELADRGMLAEAKETAQGLLELGVTDLSVVENLVLLLPRIGLAERADALRARLDSPEIQAGLSVKLADLAVLKPEAASACPPEMREMAQRVRSALAALEAGNQTQALELLQEIPRGSPLADWRYFVRGLAAFERSEAEPAAANWERLNPARPAHSIARVLRRMSAPSRSLISSQDLSLLEAAAFGDPVLDRLARLGTAVEESDWKQALRLFGPLRTALGRIDVRLAQQLTEALLEPVWREATSQRLDLGRALIDNFVAAAEPLPLDPRWNRFWALVWQSGGDPAQAAEYWERYLEDIDGVAAALGAEPRRLKAMVWRHLGELWATEAEDDEDGSPDDFFMPRYELKDPAETAKYRRRALAALRKSLDLDPAQRATHEALREACLDWQQPEAAAEAARGLLAAFPDDLPTLEFLIEYHRQRDEPAEMLRHVQQARAIKPLDEVLASQQRLAHTALARHHALAGRWKEGREEFARAESISDGTPAYWLLARKAVFELKAQQSAPGEDFLRQAAAEAPETLSLALILSIEAARYQLPDELMARFEDDWDDALPKKVTSASAGNVAEILTGYLASEVVYPGRQGHVDDAVAYLARSTRTKFQEEHLEHVCTFFHTLRGAKDAEELTEDTRKLAEKLTRRGLKLFPKSPLFLQLGAAVEMDKGALAADLRQARKLLEKALPLAQAPGSRHARLVPVIQRQLSVLRDIGEAMSQLPFGRFSGRSFSPPSPREMQQMIERLIGGLNDSPDEEDFDSYDNPFDFRGRKRKKR
jgi:hypothetical protein